MRDLPIPCADARAVDWDQLIDGLTQLLRVHEDELPRATAIYNQAVRDSGGDSDERQLLDRMRKGLEDLRRFIPAEKDALRLLAAERDRLRPGAAPRAAPVPPPATSAIPGDSNPRPVTPPGTVNAEPPLSFKRPGALNFLTDTWVGSGSLVNDWTDASNPEIADAGHAGASRRAVSRAAQDVSNPRAGRRHTADLQRWGGEPLGHAAHRRSAQRRRGLGRLGAQPERNARQRLQVLAAPAAVGFAPDPALGQGHTGARQAPSGALR